MFFGLAYDPYLLIWVSLPTEDILHLVGPFVLQIHIRNNSLHGLVDGHIVVTLVHEAGETLVTQFGGRCLAINQHIMRFNVTVHHSN